MRAPPNKDPERGVLLSCHLLHFLSFRGQRHFPWLSTIGDLQRQRPRAPHEKSDDDPAQSRRFPARSECGSRNPSSNRNRPQRSVSAKIAASNFPPPRSSAHTLRPSGSADMTERSSPASQESRSTNSSTLRRRRHNRRK